MLQRITENVWMSMKPSNGLVYQEIWGGMGLMSFIIYKLRSADRRRKPRVCAPGHACGFHLVLLLPCVPNISSS
uniref:Uncharacterized protein n=1 Tax=Theropithecus gelada TaxID=9565 RepID=A0A8D2ENY7_THEGE